MVLALDNIGHDLLGRDIEWVENCMEKDINAWAAKRAGCKVREPTQNTRAHAKCTDPPKVRGLRYEWGDANCTDVCEMHGRRFNCAGHTECAGRNCVERWVAALPTHLLRTCHSLSKQCNRGSTCVRHDEPQSASMLRVKNAIWNDMRAELFVMARMKLMDDSQTFQTCFPYLLTFQACFPCPLTFQTCF